MKNFSIGIPTICLIFITAACFAADESQNQENTVTTNETISSSSTAHNPLQKFNRGIVNIVTAPVEIAKQVDLNWKKSVQKSKSKSVGVLSGFFKGLGYTVGRMGSGIWDVVSFPFKTPDNYQPLMKPDYVIEKAKDK